MQPGLLLRAATSLILLRLSRLDGPLLFWLNLLVIDTIHIQINMFVKGVKIKTTGDSNRIDNPDYHIVTQPNV